MAQKSSFLVHSSEGLTFSDGSPPFGKNSSNFKDVTDPIKLYRISQCGTRIAWIAGGRVHVATGPEWKSLGSLSHPKAQDVVFSPHGSYMAVWDIYMKSEDGQTHPNLSVYDVKSKKLLKAFYQQSQIDWEPQWSKDEKIFARNVTGEVHFYEAEDLQNIKHKKILQKVKSFSLSPSVDNHYVTFFVPSLKSAPSFVQLYQYPNFSGTTYALATKSFFKVDSIEYIWNSLSSGVLLLTTGAPDKNNKSYYGENMLFYMNINGDAIRIDFPKEGKIRSVAWCPDGKQFFAVYGASPARTTLYDLKGNPVGEFGDGVRNHVLVNPVGNIVMLGGLGNISSRFEFWDIASRKEIAKKECSDITHMEWSPCGQYLLTSTCTPRLRVNNGYKIWHYTAALLHEIQMKELYKTTYLNDASRAVPFKINYQKVEEIEPQTKIVAASTQRYIPPSQRTGNVSTEKRFLSQRVEAEDNIAPADVAMSKSAAKNKKKREAAKKKKEEENSIEEVVVSWRNDGPPPPQRNTHEPTGDVDKDKKIRNINRKLDSIAKLKVEQENGKTLEKNQIEKIATESKLLEELESLKL